MSIVDFRPCLRESITIEDLKKNLDSSIYDKVDWDLIESDEKSLDETKEIVAWIWDRWEERRIQKNESARRRRRGLDNPYNSGIKRFAVHPYVKRYSIHQRKEDANNYERGEERHARILLKIKNQPPTETMKRIQFLENRIATLDTDLRILNGRVTYWNEKISETESAIEKEKLELQHLRNEESSSG
jgi:hypothetical protein